MNKIKTALFTTTVLLIAAVGLGMVHKQNTTVDKKFDLVIKKIGDVWKVVDSSNNSPVIIVKQKDKIDWTPQGSDVRFEFPEDYATYLKPEKNEDKPDGLTKDVKDGKKLKFKVKNNAPPDTLIYEVFIKVDSTWAVGQSPPRIIIQ